MLTSLRIAHQIVAPMMMVIGGVAAGQDYPSKSVRIITASPGGGVDFVARLIAARLSPVLGQQVVVENRGGSGIVAGDLVAKAAPDGHTLLLYGSGIWLLPFMRDKMPFDPVRDFAPVSLTNSSPNALVVHPSLPVKSVKDLIDLAKSRPGQINYASIGSGTSSQIAAELFKAMSGTNMVNVSFRGNAMALAAVLAGEVELTFGTITSALPYSKAGRLRLLAVTSAQPTPLAPGVPTVAATGLPGYESASTNAMFAPAKTPAPVITRLSQEVVRLLGQPDVKEQFFNVGLQIVASTPEQLAAAVRSEMQRLGKVIREAGIRDE